MFSDTHFHLGHCVSRGLDAAQMLSALAARDAFFALDIGTEPGDIQGRLVLAEKAFASMGDEKTAQKAESLLRFSLGIWPSKEAILDREAGVKELRANLARLQGDERLGGRIAAIGECGLDHHWNPSGVDKRAEDDFDEKVFRGEAELFEALLGLGKETGLPVIAHSRDAFEGTLWCIANSGVSRGVMHCFSYGIAEARAVLDLGWHISFSGSITYTKKSRIDEARELLRFVPADRLLIETDAPYLAPAPHRGETNTPVWVEEVYRFAAGLLEVTPEALSRQVDGNIRAFFGLP
jgi:TatD DNase family protein